MIRKTLAMAILAIGIQGGAAPAEPPPVSPPSPSAAVRCYAHDYRTQCGYWATDHGRLWAARTGAWSARIYRAHQLVWQVGGSFAYSMYIPSQPGDRVEIVLVKQSNCELPVTGGEQPGCGGAGVVIATEGFDPPYLP